MGNVRKKKKKMLKVKKSLNIKGKEVEKDSWIPEVLLKEVSKEKRKEIKKNTEKFDDDYIISHNDKIYYLKDFIKDFKKPNPRKFMDIEYDKDGNIKTNKLSYDKVADYILDEMDIKTIYKSRGEDIFIYERGIWKGNCRGLIESEIEGLLKNYAKNNTVKEIVKKIKRKTRTTREKFDKTPAYKVCLKNGVLDLSDTNNVKLLEHDKKYNFKSRIPIKYDEDAECPRFMEFIKETFYGADIPQFQEWLGLHLIDKYLFKKAVIIQGPKDTGKTVLINFITSFLGGENVAGLSLQHISRGKSFDLLCLKDAMANIYDDLDKKDLKNSGSFKMVIGDGEITGEEKFGDWFRFNNTAKMTFTCNTIPPVKDINDEAYYGRWLIWFLENKVPKEEQDKKLIDKITTEGELSGVLNWAIEGYKRLVKQNHFSNEKSPKEIKKLMMENSNLLARFASNSLEYKRGGKITKDELYKKYCRFCEKKEKTPETKQYIGKNLPKFVSYISAGKSGSTRYWKNVKFSEENDTTMKITTEHLNNIGTNGTGGTGINNLYAHARDIYNKSFLNASLLSQIDEFEIGISFETFKKTIKKMLSMKHTTPIEDVYSEFEDRLKREKIDEYLDELKDKGVIFEPRKGELMLMGG